MVRLGAGLFALVAIAAAGCHAGTFRGAGSPCGRDKPCLRPYACVAGACALAADAQDATEAPANKGQSAPAVDAKDDLATDVDGGDPPDRDAPEEKDLPVAQRAGQDADAADVREAAPAIVDPAAGQPPTTCLGLHCCPDGCGVARYDGATETLTCQRLLVAGAADCFVDHSTLRSIDGRSSRACPAGTFLRGFDLPSNLLVCCFDASAGSTRLGSEAIEPVLGTSEEAPADAAADAPSADDSPGGGAWTGGCGTAADRVATGVDRRNRTFSCAQFTASMEAPTHVLDIGASRSFAKLAAGDHAWWTLRQRNWLSRIMNLPPDGAAADPATYVVDDTQVVDGGVRRQKIHYASPVDGALVSAYLLLPPEGVAGPGPRRALVVFHGHDAKGKDATAIDWADPHHAAALYFAQQGLVTLAPDTRTWNEYLPAEQRQTGQDHAAYVEQMVIGRTGHPGAMAQMMIADALRAVSVLRGVSGVDPTAISAAGLSLGGFQALWLAALDPRVQRVVVGGLFLTEACLNRSTPPFDPGSHVCQAVPALARDRHQPWADLLFDTADLAALVAPRPLYPMWGAVDPFYGGTSAFWAACRQDALDGARYVYEKLGVRGNLADRRPAVGMGHEFDNSSAHAFLLDVEPEDHVDYLNACDDYMHCCAPGQAMAGNDVGRNLFICRDMVPPAREQCFYEEGTARADMHACPPGTWMRGVHVDHNVFTCCFDREDKVTVTTDDEYVDTDRHAQGMHTCLPGHVMTGIHVDADLRLCAAKR